MGKAPFTEPTVPRQKSLDTFALPEEANPPLVIYADAMLAFAVVFQGFQVVA